MIKEYENVSMLIDGELIDYDFCTIDIENNIIQGINNDYDFNGDPVDDRIEEWKLNEVKVINKTITKTIYINGKIL